MIEYTTEPVEIDVRVGAGYGHERAALRDLLVGPDGTSSWESVRIGRRDFPVQRMPYMLQDGIITVHEGIRINVYRGTTHHFRLLEATLEELPPSHLELFVQRKPLGIILNDYAGLSNSMRFTGGVNPSRDYADTAALDDSRGIIITYGALWSFYDNGFSPTLIHEIGHVMTHQGEINYRRFETSVRDRLISESTSGGHSRSGGRDEGLCDVYMYMICYGAVNPNLVNYWSSKTTELAASAEALEGIRNTPAFSRMLTAGWRTRYQTRRR